MARDRMVVFRKHKNNLNVNEFQYEYCKLDKKFIIYVKELFIKVKNSA